MQRTLLCAMALAVAWSAPLPARAQDAELSKIREEIRQMKDAYEKRIEALEKRLQETEAKAGKAAESAAQAENTATQAAVQASSRPQSESALNPGISAILNGIYANLKQDPNTYRINGFVPTMGEVSPGKRGLSLGESELGFSANVDHLFRGTLIASISPDNDSIGVEEGYIQTLGLSHGFTHQGGALLLRRSATRTRSTRTPGISPTRRSRTRCSSATSSATTASRSSGWRRRTCIGTSAWKLGRGRAFPADSAAGATRTASARAICSPTSAATSARALPGRRDSRTCAPRRRTGPMTTSIRPAPRSPTASAASPACGCWTAS